MAVNLPPPERTALRAVPGVELGVAAAGIKKAGRNDLLVMRLAEDAAVSAVFTRNRFCAAPVVIARRHVKNRVRALVVNTGNANAGTGTDGIARAMRVCEALASALGVRASQILPFSTGVIMEPLPADRIVAALPGAAARSDDWLSAAEAIMTTDTVPKACSVAVQLSGGRASVTGIAKGAGMIRPDMATMLAFVATDARVEPRRLASIARSAVDESFNCITVDGDTSTNDAFVAIATGLGPRASSAADLGRLKGAIADVSRKLAQAIVRDAEGATKFVTVRVEGGRSRAECRRIAYSIAQSPLVKTAFFASDPNLGRILAAIGYCGIALDASRVDLYLDEALVVKAGARHVGYREQDALAAMKKPEFTIRAVLHRGAAQATVWTCDFSFDYVRINAEYRT